MAKEHEIRYQLKYELPLHQRRKLPFEERFYLVRKVTKFGRNIELIQVMGAMAAPKKEDFLRELGLKLGRRSLAERELNGCSLDDFLAKERGGLRLLSPNGGIA